MFVSIQRGASRSREIIECDRVQIYNNNDGRFDVLSLQIWTGREIPRDIWVEVSKTDGSEVYLMNNEGKTIDSYRWAWADNPEDNPPK